MKFKPSQFIIAMLAVFLFFAAGIQAQNLDPKVVEVATNLYLITGLDGSGNIAFLVTSKGVLVVDSGELPAIGKIIIEKVKEKTDQPITHVIFTHYHPDHTYGIRGLPENITLVGHINICKNIEEINKKKFKDIIEKDYPAHLEKLQQELKQLKAENNPKANDIEKKLKLETEYYNEYKTTSIKIPTLTFKDKLEIKLGDEIVQLIYPGSAHTNCNCLVYFPKHKVIHTGDILFQGSYPFLDYKGGTDTLNWIAALEKISRMDAEKIIPGHGQLTTKKDLEILAAYLKELRQQVKDNIAKGLSLEKMQETIQFPAFKDFAWSDLRNQNIEQVYLEFTSKQEKKE